MILSSPFPLKGSILLCLLISAGITFINRRSFTGNSVIREEKYSPFMGNLTPLMSGIILFTVFLLFMGMLFPGLILNIFTDTAALDLFRLLLPPVISYILLWFFIPVLRKHFHPAFCAVCWVLPNIAYFSYFSPVSLFDSLVIIPVSSSLLKTAGLVWLGGFLTVMIYRVISHLRFRRALMAAASEITEGHVYEIYLNLLKEYRCQKTYRLGISPSLNTPLSIGLLEDSIIILLPDRNYTDEQLELILRHELIHIQRSDSYTKFFMSIVSAAGWFIPFTWMTSFKAAQDLELSCDQTVISGCDEKQRKEYAELILSSTCDEKGFTTCLAAKAEDLQYRLREIVKPQKKRYGTVLIFLICFVIISCYGSVSLAADCGTIGEKITENSEEISDIHITSVSRNRERKTVIDEAGLYTLIASKGLMKTGFRQQAPADPVSDENGLIIFYIHRGGATYTIEISGRTCRIRHPGNVQGTQFILKEPFDADDLNPYID